MIEVRHEIKWLRPCMRSNNWGQTWGQFIEARHEVNLWGQMIQDRDEVKWFRPGMRSIDGGQAWGQMILRPCLRSMILRPGIRSNDWGQAWGQMILRTGMRSNDWGQAWGQIILRTGMRSNDCGQACRLSLSQSLSFPLFISLNLSLSLNFSLDLSRGMLVTLSNVLEISVVCRHSLLSVCLVLLSPDLLLLGRHPPSLGLYWQGLTIHCGLHGIIFQS